MEQEVMGTEGNCSYPLGSSQLILDKATDSGNVCKQNQSQNPKSSLGYDIPRKPESNCLHVPFLNTNYIVSTLPTDNLNVIPPLATYSQHNEGGHCGVEEKSQTPINVPNKSDLEQEEMETEHNMWKLRANRVRKILSAEREFGPFTKSKKYGLEFNVGFNAKKNISVDTLLDTHLLEVAKFAIAMNSSKQDFIMEILEHNFDFGLQSEYQQNIFTLEIMNRVRELENCEDAIKFSNDVFELPVRPCMGNVKHQVSNIMKIEECKFSPLLPPHSQANTSEHISQKSLDLYPFCQEIGLKLNVNNHLPKKLDIKKLSNGSITEVTNFAEKLCGTFEQTCLDILRHNFSYDFQSEDPDLARNILARIPFLVEKQNLSNCVIRITGTDTRKDSSIMVKLDCQSNQKVDACKADSLQTVKIDQQVDRSTDFRQQDELNLKLWKCRSNQIEQILSVPHEEHCPLYSFSRCKKLGIDFNVGSGFKQNLDPELLTNGIMVELNTFAATLISAQMHFITEILEYNCDLDLRNELHRSAFAHEVWRKMKVLNLKKTDKDHQKKKLFELPDLMCLQNPTKYCPKCFQERSHKLFQDDSDPSHMHHLHPLTMADIVSGDANCTEQRTARDQSSTFSGREETIMANYPSCKEIGFILFVDKDKPKYKFGTNVLTNEIIHEVARFTKMLSGTKIKVFKDVLEHNFNLGMQGRDLNPTLHFHRATPDWFNEVYVIRQKARKRETTVKKRTYPLQTEKERVDDYTCALVESDLDSDKFTDSGNCGIQDNLKNPNNSLSLDIPGQLKSRCLVILAPLHTTDDISSSLPTVNSNANQTNEGGCCEVNAQTQTSKNTLNNGDMKQEEMETENNMWKLRANRVRKILSTFVFSPLYNSRKFALEFNVGFSAKKNISVDNLRDNNLLEVAKFAIAMNSSKQDFIMEILEHNFDFGLQSEYQLNIFTLEIMNRVRELENCEDAIKFSNEVFELPGRPNMGNVKPQLGNILKIEECEFSPLLPPHSQANTSEHISRKVWIFIPSARK
ncbi:Dihydroxy-acid dehydratase [Dissostichus eleginoides]|uniref:Dihydroxy-acid dehydratase n=1 Tax=Dissostichus eleginoides TaxID=100907 RepID=A0AAD9F1K1_DISEL|nr:Dihydroxy-acid dehydratase [Dissostichus eleginoides]